MEQGVDPNLRDGDGATPLHFAASRGHLTTVRWLLSHGARISLDRFGKSPINDAAENQQVEVCIIIFDIVWEIKCRILYIVVGQGSNLTQLAITDDGNLEDIYIDCLLTFSYIKILLNIDKQVILIVQIHS